MQSLYIVYPPTTSIINNAFGWFKESGAKYDIDVEVFFWGRLGVLSREDGTEVIIDDLPIPDFVLLRGYNISLSHLFESKGVKMVNTASSMEKSRNKMLTQRILEAHKIPMPKLFEDAEMLPPVYVVKQYFGSKGESVELIESRARMEVVKEKFASICRQRVEDFENTGGVCSENGDSIEEIELGSKILYQEYVESSRGRDVRVWVIGDKVVGAVLRQNTNAFKSNFAQGGGAFPFNVTPQISSLAITATKCLGLEFAGVDLLFAEDRFLVCEVNGNPGFRTASIVGAIDIPDRLMVYLHNLKKT